MRVTILFGSEFGTAEEVAEHLADVLCAEHEASVYDMNDFDPGDLDVAHVHIIVCSTYGDGELPTAAEYFFGQLDAASPDLTGLRFAVFGLGDSIYQNSFNRGGEIAAEKLTRWGAIQLGEHARHDASTEVCAKAMAADWVATLSLGALVTA